MLAVQIKEFRGAFLRSFLVVAFAMAVAQPGFATGQVSCESVFAVKKFEVRTASPEFISTQLRPEYPWRISLGVAQDLVAAYSRFYSQFDYHVSHSSNAAFHRPFKARHLNELVEKYNQSVPEEFLVVIKFFDHPQGEMSNLDYIRNWANSRLPLDQGHDWLVHVPAHLPLAYELTQKSIYNMGRVLELIDHPLVANRFFLRKFLIGKFADSIENLYRPVPNSNSRSLEVEWQSFAITPEYFDRVIEEAYRQELPLHLRSPELLDLIRKTRNRLFTVSQKDADLYYKIMKAKLSGAQELVGP